MKVVANKRDAQGTSASRRLRHAGKVPGVLYGGSGAAQAIEVEHNPLFHALRKEKFHASILEMELDGKAERVLLRDFQMHPYRPVVLHVDFQRVSEDQKIHMRVPLHFSGQEESPAVKAAGGLVNHVMSEVDVACLPKDLPEFIQVDLSGLQAHQSVRVLDLKMPAGVTPVLKGKENPVVVAVSRTVSGRGRRRRCRGGGRRSGHRAEGAAPAAGRCCASPRGGKDGGKDDKAKATRRSKQKRPAIGWLRWREAARLVARHVPLRAAGLFHG